jgi:transglutaminase-like putative cysteine protease
MSGNPAPEPSGAAAREPSRPPPRLPPLLSRQWPRETRDTLFVLAVIGWTILPHLPHLPLWCGLLAGAILVWRGALALTQRRLPNRWVLAAVLGLAAGLTWWSQNTLLGKDAGVTLMVVLMALKTLELRARRDALVVFFLGFFLVLTNFFYSQSLLTALTMLVAVWGLLTALVLAHMPVGRPPLRAAASLAGRAALLGTPLMVALFLLFPRIGPLWAVPQDGIGRTGLGDRIRMGSVAEIANDEAVALRLRFLGAVPPASALYFRGPVLSAFDGVEWTHLIPSFPPRLRPQAELDLIGEGLRYEMTVEPGHLPLLPMLEATPDTADSAPRVEGLRLRQTADLQWLAERPVSERVRVQAQAWLAFRHGPEDEIVGLRDFVSLPPGYNPRTLAWAAALRNDPRLQDATPQQLAAAVLAHIGRDGFSYTLEPGTYGRDGIDEFWLDRKAGFCEHFAAAFVVVMRALDVPARIVTGYQGADAAPVDGYWIVRQSNAHAWAEYWVAGSGWVRADPTAAVAPDRVRRGRSLVRPPGLVAGALGTMSPQLLAQLRSAWEGLDNRWNQWVLSYARTQQFELLRALGVRQPDWDDLARVSIALIVTASLAGAGWALWDRQRQAPWQRLQQRVAARLARLGVAVQPHEPPRARAARVRQGLGANGEPVALTLEALDRLRYARGATARPSRDWWRRFAAACRAAQRQ